jgi:hypothetical protein
MGSAVVVSALHGGARTEGHAVQKLVYGWIDTPVQT